MTNIPKHPFVLIDCSSYFYRAFHALPPLTNSKGQPTGAVYGVINMIRKLITDYEPEYVAVVLDAKGKTFRDELYSEYKATRPPMPEELSVQFEPMIEFIRAMGLPLLMVEGVEADDVIGTLAMQATKAGMHTLISTGDKDMAQLVNEQVTLINTMSNKVMDPDGVVEKFAVKPEQIIDYLTLMGDKVDNVPGVEKVGPKTAAKWLDEYGSLDEVMKHADDFKGKVGENLRRALTHLPLSKTLVTLKSDVKLEFTPKELKREAQNDVALLELCKEMEFKRWLEALLQHEPAKEVENNNFQTILSEKDFDAWLAKLKESTLFAFDTETTSLDYMEAEIVGVSFAVKPGEAAYVPVAHSYEGAPEQLSRDYVLAKLKPLLEDKNQQKIAQNIKYDMSVLAKYDIQVQGFDFDSMLESYVLNSAASRHDMNTLALKYLGKRTIHFEDVAGKGAKQVTFDKVPLDKAGPYAAEDADITFQLHEALWPQLEKIEGLKKTYEAIEMPLVPVLSSIERVGVLIDPVLLGEQSKELAKRLEELQVKAFELAGEEFNLASPKQLQEILFTKLKLPVLQKTPKGQASTAESVLQELALDYPLPEVIIEYRQLSKLKSTYTDALPQQINPQTGRVHTSYNQAVTATGRLSSTEPNLQNIPVRREEGRRIRQAFIAPKGTKIVAADYSQIELRIMAHLTDDPGLMKAFTNGWDIHTATASEVFGVTLDEVTADQRRNAKAINFGLIYGMSAFGLAKQIGTERHIAQEYIDLYFQRYPNVKKYMDDTRELAHKTGYVETIFGRRLYLPEINARNMQRQRAAERAAINAPMQGSAADIIKIAMIDIYQWLQNETINVKMIMQVHDELVFEVAENEVDAIVKKIDDIMCNCVALSVPMEVHIGVGDNWELAH